MKGRSPEMFRYVLLLLKFKGLSKIQDRNNSYPVPCKQSRKTGTKNAHLSYPHLPHARARVCVCVNARNLKTEKHHHPHQINI